MKLKELLKTGEPVNVTVTLADLVEFVKTVSGITGIASSRKQKSEF